MKTWAERIAEAKKRGRFSGDDWIAANWFNSCSIGEATGFPDTTHKALDRLRLLVPDHREFAVVYKAGMDFFDAVSHHKIDEAERLHAIISSSIVTDESLIAATVEEAKKHAAEELVSA